VRGSAPVLGFSKERSTVRMLNVLNGVRFEMGRMYTLVRTHDACIRHHGGTPLSHSLSLERREARAVG
jgi:hypothetical protein